VLEEESKDGGFKNVVRALKIGLALKNPSPAKDAADSTSPRAEANI